MHRFGLDFYKDLAVLPTHFVSFVRIGLIEDPETVGNCVQVVRMLAWSKKDLFHMLRNDGQGRLVLPLLRLRCFKRGHQR
jgi:hypothetical protein